MTVVDEAMMLALEVHSGDVNKHDGEPYVLHLARVWMNVRDRRGTNIQQAIAWLHDSVEDDKISFANIRERIQLPSINNVINGVDAMTKRKGESNRDYYLRLKMNDDARFVKLNGDIVDNFSRNHKILDPATKLRMAEKYSLGMEILK